MESLREMIKFIRTVQKKWFDVYNTTQWLHSAEHCVGNDNRFIFVITKRLFLFLLASLVLTLYRQPIFGEKKAAFWTKSSFLNRFSASRGMVKKSFQHLGHI